MASEKHDESSYQNASYCFVNRSNDGHRLDSLTKQMPGNIQELQRALVIIRGGDPRNYADKLIFGGLDLAIQFFEEFIRQKDNQKKFSFYRDLLPTIIKYATEYDKYCREWPLMMKQVEQTVTLKAHEIRFMLANAFFLNVTTISKRSGGIKNRRYDYGAVDFGQVFSTRLPESIQRISCLLAYFYLHSETDKNANESNNNNNNNNNNHSTISTDYDVVFSRHVLLPEQIPKWRAEEVQIKQNTLMRIHTDKMEATTAPVFVDFANRQLHIGCIIPSFTQEEVLFAVAPDCYPALLIAETLDDNEAFVIRGLRRYVDYTGYLSTFTMTSLFRQRPSFATLAIDSVMVHHFDPRNIIRDLNKAYIGFKACKAEKQLSTASWGCGAFGGDTSEKFVQQLCAAELAGVQLDYSCYKRDGLKDDLSDIWKLIQNKKATIGQLIEICCDFENVGGVFHDYLLKQLKKL